MPFSYRRLFFGGQTFCCCLPVRLGVISMSILGCLVAGLLTVLLWFEVSSTTGMTSSERTAFILAGLTETFLFVASIIGLVGAIVRKLSFTLVYAYILCIHFVINLGVAAYLLYEIMRTSRNAQRLACQTAIKDPQAQGQCSGLLAFAKWVYIAVAGTVLFVEMYGAIIVTRYLNQLKREKSDVSAMQRDTENAFELKRSLNGHNYARLHNPASPNMVPPPEPYHLGPSETEYNPYEEVATVERNDTFRDGERPPPPIEVGYGGGSWTLSGIVDEEKERLKRNELAMDAQEASSSRSGNPKRDYDPQLDGKSPAHEDTPLPLYTQTYHPS